MPPILVTHLLAAWREAERMEAESEPGSPEHVTASVAVQRIKELYSLVTEGAADDAGAAEPVGDSASVGDRPAPEIVGQAG